MLLISKNRSNRIPTINIDARIPLLLFTNRNEKRKKDEISTIDKKKITG